MSSIDNLPVWLAIVVAGGPILLGFIGIAYSLYLSRCHLDAMMAALKNSRYSYTWGPILREQGWMGSMLVVAQITGMILMPKPSIRIGDLHPKDLENFPSNLRCLLKIDAAIMLSCFVWMVIVGTLLKFK
ncbi:hypothetical protein [Pseudomonas turukhanskensis]|uniref:Uncharacterized protein n=1 Tax=Pseudomonas turukhanskensis TaxID=1806536 RepID=A0A9W6K7D8_9PSED|nr:hypothetical protein [Pseudomonas turukhanskensis]GLK89384.1 hypothetical protein GCM10017655_24460 [Pseudomonas turukhanskensis]